jgi:hypothetical protein
MSNWVDSLNLRPQEKRAIVAIAAVVFVILNLVLVFPHFKDYSQIQKQLKETSLAIATNKAIIAKDVNPVNGLQVQLARLEKQPDGVVTFSKDIQLIQTVTDQARASGFIPTSQGAAAVQHFGPTNLADKFFESQSARIQCQAAEDALVRFLFNLGNDPAMIRVRELDLKPVEPNRYKLNANITLIADYQKTNAPKAVLTATVAPPKPAAQPPAPVPKKAGARSAATNAAPAASRTPPLPAPPAPGRAGAIPMPPVPTVPPVPPVPARPPRTPVGG